jgi:hypothetical protein
VALNLNLIYLEMHCDIQTWWDFSRDSALKANRVTEGQPFCSQFERHLNSPSCPGNAVPLAKQLTALHHWAATTAMMGMDFLE